VLLAAMALSLSIVLGAPGPGRVSAQTASPKSQLPATAPGLSHNEGVFLVTAADDGSQLVYFIAQNARHSTLPADLQLEQQLNSLWPVWLASRDDVLAFPEAAPVGRARNGLLTGPVAAEPALDTEAAAPPDAMTYTVKAGDSAIRIARRFSVDVDALLNANGVVNPNRVFIGQVLSIPEA